MIKSFLRDGFIYGLTNIIARGLPLITLPIFTIYLAPSDFGIIDLAVVLTSIIKLTVALEITQAIARFFSDADTEEDKAIYASTALWFSVAMYSLTISILLLFRSEIAAYVFSSEINSSLVIIILLTIWTEGLFYLMQTQLRYQLASSRYSRLTLSHAILSTTLALLLMSGFGMGVTGFFYGLFISGVVNLVFALLLVGRHLRFVFKWDVWKKMVTFSTPLVPSGIALFSTTYIDRIFINYLMDLEQLGIYGVAYRIAMIAGVSFAGFQVALMPLIYKHYHEPETPKHIELIFRVLLSTVLPLLLLISLFSGELIELLSSETFSPSASIIPWLGSAIILSYMNIFAPGLLLEKKTIHIMSIHIAAAVINAILNLLLIPELGLLGAAIATCISSVIVLCFYFMGNQRHYPVPYAWIPIFTAAFITAATIYMGSPMNLMERISVFIIITSIVIMTLITRKEISLAVGIIRRQFSRQTSP